jgi:hypothetical protein
LLFSGISIQANPKAIDSAVFGSTSESLLPAIAKLVGKTL